MLWINTSVYFRQVKTYFFEIKILEKNGSAFFEAGLLCCELVCCTKNRVKKISFRKKAVEYFRKVSYDVYEDLFLSTLQLYADKVKLTPQPGLSVVITGVYYCN